MDLKEIPIFFATDDNYVDCLAVAIHSMERNQSKNYKYCIKILTTGLNEQSKMLLNKLVDDNNSIDYVDISEHLKYLEDELHTRDYYSKSTYYRLFIPKMFPEYKKVLYLDCDIVVNGDISKMYNTNIGHNLLGAVADESVQITPEFIDYVEKALGIPKKQYFNAGILIMNLEQLRKQNFEKQFVELLNQYTFKVAQDQDYLNVICKNKVHYMNLTWDKMPLKNDSFKDKTPMLIHYNMGWKPWKSDNILYQDYFWNYAKEIDNYTNLLKLKKNYSIEDRQRDEMVSEGLINMCIAEANSPINYFKLYVDKPQGNTDGENPLDGFSLESVYHKVSI